MTKIADGASSLDTEPGAPSASRGRAQERVEATYLERTARSRALHARALGPLPGGSTRAGTFYRPHPTYMDRGNGCRLFDVDGNTYLDFLNNYTSLIHGHAHSRLAPLLAEQAERGLVHGAPMEAEILLAE